MALKMNKNKIEGRVNSTFCCSVCTQGNRILAIIQTEEMFPDNALQVKWVVGCYVGTQVLEYPFPIRCITKQISFLRATKE